MLFVLQARLNDYNVRRSISAVEVRCSNFWLASLLSQLFRIQSLACKFVVIVIALPLLQPVVVLLLYCLLSIFRVSFFIGNYLCLLDDWESVWGLDLS